MYIWKWIAKQRNTGENIVYIYEKAYRTIYSVTLANPIMLVRYLALYPNQPLTHWNQPSTYRQLREDVVFICDWLRPKDRDRRQKARLGRSWSLWFSLVICFHNSKPWWRHQIETFSALLAVCAGNSPTQRPVTRSFDVFFDLRPNKRLSKQWWGWWFETPSWPLWRHCDDICQLNTEIDKQSKLKTCTSLRVNYLGVWVFQS